jgi:hypothetical protein
MSPISASRRMKCSRFGTARVNSNSLAGGRSENGRHSEISCFLSESYVIHNAQLSEEFLHRTQKRKGRKIPAFEANKRGEKFGSH